MAAAAAAASGGGFGCRDYHSDAVASTITIGQKTHQHSTRSVPNGSTSSFGVNSSSDHRLLWTSILKDCSSEKIQDFIVVEPGSASMSPYCRLVEEGPGAAVLSRVTAGGVVLVAAVACLMAATLPSTQAELPVQACRHHLYTELVP